MSLFTAYGESAVMPSSLMFRGASFLPDTTGIDSPPSSPDQSSLFARDGLGPLDFPFLLPTPTTSTSSSSSPSSSPLSSSADDSSDYAIAAPSHKWPGPEASHSAAHYGAHHAPSWHPAVVPLSLDQSHRLPSPPPHASSFRADSINSSSASSVSSGSDSGTPSTTEETQLIVKKRKRSKMTLNAEERLQRRRAQHRAVDANRRNRENDAITRLTKLIRQQQQALAGGVDELAGEADEDDSDGAKQKAGRLTVLESSIALIEQLTAACKRMDEACNAKDAQVVRVSNQLHSVAANIAHQASSLALVEPLDVFSKMGLQGVALQSSAFPSMNPPGTWGQQVLLPADAQPAAKFRSGSNFLAALPPPLSSYLQHADMSQAMAASTSALFSTMCVALIVLPSKVVIDVNDCWVAMTGYKRSEMLYRAMDQITAQIPQYPASFAAINEVINGEKKCGSAVWRCIWADGLLYENTCTFYGVFDDPATEGQAQRRPDKMLIFSPPEDRVRCDHDEVILGGVMERIGQV